MLLKQWLRKNSQGQKKYIQGPIEATVVLSVERYLHCCDVTLNAAGQTYQGHEETDDMYTSMDKVMDKIERQIDKNKGRMRAGRTSAS